MQYNRDGGRMKVSLADSKKFLFLCGSKLHKREIMRVQTRIEATEI